MKRMNFHLTDDQEWRLRELSGATGAPAAWHVRKAIDEYLERAMIDTRFPKTATDTDGNTWTLLDDLSAATEVNYATYGCGSRRAYGKGDGALYSRRPRTLADGAGAGQTVMQPGKVVARLR